MDSQLVKGMVAQGAAYVVAVDGTQMVEKARRIHELWPVTTAAMGRLLMGTCILASEIKEEKGSVTVSIGGGGPVGRMIAVGTPDGKARASITNPHVDLPPRQDGKLDVGSAVARTGRLSVVRDNGVTDPYIGQINLQSGEIAEDFAYYFAQSEQKPCLIFLGVMVGREQNVEAAGGLAVFPLPGCPEDVIQRLEEKIPQAAKFSKFIQETGDAQESLFRIFLDMDLSITERRSVRYQCNCSYESIQRALMSMGQAELLDMIEKDGKAEVCCQFCNTTYYFDENDLRVILKQAIRSQEEG